MKHSCSRFRLLVNLDEEMMQEECEYQSCGELVPPEPGTRQMTRLIFAVEHRNAGDGLQIQAQCESTVSVT